MILSAIIVGAISNRLKRAFKREVIPVLLANIDPSLAFHMDGYIDERTFNAAELYQYPNRYSGKDLVEGRIGDTAVRFSFVNAEEQYQQTTTDSDGHSKTETRYRTIFNGLFFVADFNKHFTGRTLVRPRSSNFFSKFFGSHIALEDPDFEKRFSVTSTDQVSARYILTPSLMERLKHLHDTVGTFNASFCDSRLFLAIKMPPDSFEPSVRRSFLENDQIERILDNLRTITSIVGELGLNVRIWSKPPSP